MAEVTQYFSNLPWLELMAMLLALAYVVLAANGSLWCWPAAFISTALYTIIFYDVLLLMDSALNLYYLVMAFYGYWIWQKKHPQVNYQKTSLEVISLPANKHLKIGITLAAISLVLGYVMANYTPAAFPYLDTFTTVFAIFATYLVTQKVLENWLYWLVIDTVSIYLYLEKGLFPTAALFVIYIIIASYGYVKWYGFYKNNQLTLSAQISN
ncbi:MAG: nicotinamide riboside transporter PnuC [Litorilituus sp.]|jgi:nicotinamide mononucleotide transporter|nr:nicotinamide riboside transporter PnuC [Litorilituus sp.]